MRSSSGATLNIGWANFGRELAFLALLAIVITWLFSRAVYPALGVPQDGPIPARTVLLVLATTLLLRRRGQRWSQFGLIPWRRPLRVLGLTVLLFATHLFVIQPASDIVRDILNLGPSDISFFAHIQNNPRALAFWIAIAWTAASFGEELLMRGYLLGRLVELFGSGWWGATLAVVGAATIYAVAHLYRGPGGFLAAGITGLMYGAFFFLAGRSLWPLILEHGIWDSLGAILLYANGVPST